MSQFLNSCHLASVFAGSSSCLPEASVVFVEQSAQDGSRGTSTGMHMNTSQLSLQQEKGWEGIGRDMELSGQIQPRPLHDTMSWVHAFYLHSSLLVPAEPWEARAQLSHCCTLLRSSSPCPPRALVLHKVTVQAAGASLFEPMVSAEM